MIEHIIFSIVCAVLITFVIVFIAPTTNFFLRKHFGLHAWSYRNPHDRTCAKCNRREVEHRYAWQPNSMGFWEVFKEGNGRTFICRKHPINNKEETETVHE